MDLRYFFAADGAYLGAFDEGSINMVPEGAIEVFEPPSHGLDKLVNGEVVPYVEEKPLNQILEDAFKQVLPNHLGQPYLTPAVIRAIMTTKTAVMEANSFDPSGYLGKATIEGLSLPEEMRVDKENLLDLFPSSSV